MTKADMCRSMVSARKCQFHNSVAQFKNNSEFSETVCDIEDMVKLGQRYEVCPYYLSKELQGSADVVFMPYNYLVDPEVRKNLTISLADSVLIFDEAHNLEGICGDAASFDFTAGDLAACVREVQHAIDIALRPGYGGAGNNGEPVSADELAQLKTLLLKLEEVVDSAKLEEGGGPGGGGFTRDGPYIYTILGGIGITNETHTLVIKLIEDTVALITDESEGVGIHTTASLSQFNSYLKSLFKVPLNEPDHPSQYYKVHIHTDKNRNQSQSGGLFSGKGNKKAGKEGRTLSYWCFNPGVAMQALIQSGVRSVILTSGTLSPMDSFAYELKTPFQVQLENSHVIGKGQVWVGVVAKGPSGQPLNSSYQNRDSTTYKSDLGNTIVNILITLVNYARIVPNGLLVFFPSYGVLTASIDYWKMPTPNSSTTIWERICSHKQPVIEPRESHQFPLAIEDFYQKVKDPGKDGGGAIFFAVCRGKVSEGLDFADQNGRAVIITGLPYPALDDPKIKLKREYLNNSKPSGNAYVLRGGEWYSQQASRAVNQAVGRVIRHRHDYGAIILCDERFGQRGAQDQLSKWLRPHMKMYNQFGESTMSLIHFFRNINVNGSEVIPGDNSISKSNNSNNTTISTTTTTKHTPVPSSSTTNPIKLTTPTKPEQPPPTRSALLDVLNKANDNAFSRLTPPSTTAKAPVKLSEQLMKRNLPSKNKDKTTEPTTLKNDPEPLKTPPLPPKTTATIPKNEKPNTQISEKQLNATQFNAMAKRILSEADYIRFHAILRDLKAKKVTLDTVVRQVRELAAGEVDLLEQFVLFIPTKHQTKYREFLLHGTEPQLSNIDFNTNSNSNSNPNSNPNSNSNSNPNPNSNSNSNSNSNPIPNSNPNPNPTPKPNNNLNFNTNSTSTNLIPNSKPTNFEEDERDIMDDSKNLTSTTTTTTITNTTALDDNTNHYDSKNTTHPLSPTFASNSTPQVAESPSKRAQQYDLISGQPAKKKMKVASRSSLLTSSSNKEDEEQQVEIPDPEAKSEATVSGCVCSICHQKASSPFNARCGHICCHACWIQWLQEKLECPVCREKTRPKQLTKLYFL